ncbi:signal peptide peptidase-like 2 [Nematolebias whitei]|uniref:signal peptide peptidase-like 2 n=1 Tax=Nematolebias whitei TaxID=451745 RepID=UPI00189B8E7B|nr:signal peptide peptidase-like 2 [Nematolebias whitei]
MQHIRSSLPPSLDPYQFAYRSNRSTDDAVATALHSALTHLDKKDTYVRMLFIDFSSAFNTIIPQQLIWKLDSLGLNTSLCNWLLDFLTGRPQAVRVGSNTSSIITLNTGAPQGCVLSPLLFTLLTYDCSPSHPSNLFIKFADDTTVVGLISNNDESLYRSEVSRLVSWCKRNNLLLNTEKTKEIVVDFRRTQTKHAPLSINGVVVERVSSTKFLGVHISEDLSWTINTAAVAKKAHQRLYFLRKRRRARAPTPMMTTFYRGAIESILMSCSTVWYGACTASCRKSLQRISRLQIYDLTSSVLCLPSDVPEGGFPNRIPMVMRGNCTFYEKVRLAQINGAKGLLIVSKERLTPPAGNKTQYEEIDIPVALLSYSDSLDISKTFGEGSLVAMYAPNEPVLDYNMVIIFLMAVGTVAIGGYWAGSSDSKKRYMKHKRDDGADKQDEETVDVTPIMICVFVVMCCNMLVLLYFFYDHLALWVIGIFCVASSVGLHSCLWPFVRRIPFCKCRIPENNLPYLHKRPQIRMLLLSALCIGVSIIWMVFRNEDQWAWVLQDALGITFCLYMLKTVRLSTFKACTLLLSVLFVYDVFFVFITPFFTKSGESIMVEVAAGPSDSATHEKLPMVLKVPRLNSSPLALCDRPFSLLGFGDILVPGLLVVYCHRFDILTQSSRIYFVTCTIAYGIGLLITFVALAVMQMGQPALLYLVPCTLITSLAVALWRKELPQFWTGSGFVPPIALTPINCTQTAELQPPPQVQEPSA